MCLDYTDTGDVDESRKAGVAWTFGKNQDGFLMLSDLVDKEAIGDPHDVELMLKINGEIRQHDNTGNMYYKIGDQIEHISKYMTLNPGDVIMTGTPEGVGPVKEGDLLEASMSYKGKMLTSITDTI